MKPNVYRPASGVALILSPDPLAAALIGAAVELAGMPLAFAGPDEPARAALRRVRPTFVLLACDDAAVRDEFLGPAMMMGTRLFLFGTERSLQLLEAVVGRYRLGVIALPRDVGQLREILTAGTESSRRQRESTAP